MGWPEMQTAIERLADAMTKDQREQRRYEIARDVMAALLTKLPDGELWASIATESVRGADALLKALEESSDGE